MIEIMPIDFSTPSSGDATISMYATNGEATCPSLTEGSAFSSVGSDGKVASPTIGDGNAAATLPSGESSLVRLVSENAALGDALKKIVDDFGKVEAKIAPVASPVTFVAPAATPAATAAAGIPDVSVVETSAALADDTPAPAPEATVQTLRQLIVDNGALGVELEKAVDDFKKAEIPGASAVESSAALAGDTSVPAPEATVQTLRQLIVDNDALGVELEKAVDEIQKVEVRVAGEEVAASGEATAQALPESPVVLQAADAAFVSADATGTPSSPSSATDAPTAVPVRAARAEAASQTLQEEMVPLQTVDPSSVPAASGGNVAAPLAAAAPADVSPSAVLVQAADAVAETILVTPELARGRGEIRIQLQPDVLGGSTVSVAVTGRQIEVTFIPATHEIAVLLAGNQSVLATQLATRIRSFNVTVDVRRTSSYDSEEIA